MHFMCVLCHGEEAVQGSMVSIKKRLTDGLNPMADRSMQQRTDLLCNHSS